MLLCQQCKYMKVHALARIHKGKFGCNYKFMTKRTFFTPARSSQRDSRQAYMPLLWQISAASAGWVVSGFSNGCFNFDVLEMPTSM